MAQGIIYQAFDTSNGKCYVGQTWERLEIRRRHHTARQSNCRVFKNALLKRPAAFVWTILTTCSTQQEMDEAETYWGSFFSSIFPDGYNLKLGNAHGIFSEEARAAMSRAGKGKKKTLAHRQAIGRNWLGRKHTPEAREKIRQAALRRGRRS